ncbi:uncharacterized protein NEMAJ01_1800 [Nematocida major]|uniref:uncharacterized protein n=1 Tax=Nematocida major TaxID=1912982 RepID=UPI002008BAC5|nr:uncharacterized protein NEMAJ01_1800 [Nematocida major]KAH9386904.1 hypothetical protein NEMAJ01_1800 [Nematocida major]
MKASEVLKREIVHKWAREISKEIETESILILKYDLVPRVWADEISEVLMNVRIRNACTRLTCPKTCPVCVAVIEAMKKKDKMLCINCKSLKLLYVKIMDMRYQPVKIISIDKGVMGFIKSVEGTEIIGCSENMVHLPPAIHTFFERVDQDYMSPVLIVKMLKYLEYEKSIRADPTQLEDIILGLRVSFLCDSSYIETSRMNLYRQNKAEKSGLPG